MVFVKGQKPNKGRTKPRIGRKIKGMNKNAKQTAYYAATAWKQLSGLALVITALTVSQDGNLCVRLGKELKCKATTDDAEPRKRRCIFPWGGSEQCF